MNFIIFIIQMSNLKLRTVKKYAKESTGKYSDQDSKIMFNFNVYNFSVRIYVFIHVGWMENYSLVKDKTLCPYLVNSQGERICSNHLFFFNIYSWERERESTRVGGSIREKETQIWSRLQALSCQHRPWCGGSKPLDHDLSQNQTLNRLSHPGAPL